MQKCPHQDSLISLELEGLAQCTELCLQLRGQADKRQVQGARVALQHNLGLGGAVVVALYKMGFQQNNETSPQSDGYVTYAPLLSRL